MLRRSVLLAAAGSALALPHTALSQGRLRYTAATAPDSITREILRNSLARLDVGPYDVLTNLSMNFGQIIDQNFARMNGQRIGMLLDNMRPMELQALAQMYTNSTANRARSSRLHELLALRIDGARLGHASRAFGFAPMYEAINRLAPEKAMQFMENSNPGFRSPTPGESPLGASAMRPVRFMQVQRGPMPGIEMTIMEIYLEYRTAPIGSLGPMAAAYQTSVYSLGHLAVAFYAGYQLGTGISWLLQTYAPSVSDALGAGLYNFFAPIVNIFQTGTPTAIGNTQMNMAYSPFSLASIAPVFAATGGDYGVVHDWSMNAGGGGCGGDPDGCPIQQ